MADLGFWSFAQRESDVLALVDPFENEITRGELLALCNQIVHGLRAHGLERGDVVAIDSVNCAEYIATSLACNQAGFYLTPINWHLAPAEVAYILGDCEAKVFIGHENIGEICAKAVKEVGFDPEASYAIGQVDGFKSFASLLAGQSADMPEKRCAGGTMNYTSGTTGNPKGVKRPLAPPEIEPDLIGGMMAGFLAMFGVQPEDDNVYICGSPLYHTAVLMQAVW